MYDEGYVLDEEKPGLGILLLLVLVVYLIGLLMAIGLLVDKVRTFFKWISKFKVGSSKS